MASELHPPAADAAGVAPASDAALEARRASWVFLIASLVSGLAFALVTPPFEVPDEPNHFFRIVRVSEGRLDLPWHPAAAAHGPAGSAAEQRAAAEVDVPEGAVVARDTLHGGEKWTPGGYLFTREHLRAALRIPLGTARRTVFIANSLQLPITAYATPAVAAMLARWAGAPALGLLYAARLANLLAASLVLFVAIRRLPALPWWTTAIALTPMATSLRASASPDGIMLALFTLTFALVAQATWGAEPSTRRSFLLLLASAGVAVTTKIVYVPLVLLAVMIPTARWPPPARRWRVALVATVALALAWSIATASRVPRARFDVYTDQRGQVLHVLAHPLWFAGLVIETYAKDAPELGRQLIGRLGWLGVPLPATYLAAYGVLLLLLLLLDGSPAVRVRLPQRMLVLAAVAGAAGLIAVAQYAQWTPYRNPELWGLQGRYYLPLAGVAAWVSHGRTLALRRKGALACAVAAMAAVSLVVSCVALIRRYY